MAFLIHSTDDGHMVPWEYLEIEKDTDANPEYRFGSAWAYSDEGKFMMCNSSNYIPQYILMADNIKFDEDNMATVPVIRVTEDIVFEAPLIQYGTGAKVGQHTGFAMGNEAWGLSGHSGGPFEIVSVVHEGEYGEDNRPTGEPTIVRVRYVETN